MKQIIIVLAVTILHAGCNQKKVEQEKEALANKIDSLMSTLAGTRYTVGLLEQVGQYMDSIDHHRKWITIHLEKGIGEDDYISRMKSVNAYVRKAEWTIDELEKTRSTYASLVYRLKGQIALKDEEILKLQMIITEHQAGHQELEDHLIMSKSQLAEAENDLQMTDDELKGMIAKNEELLNKIQLTEAEILFTRAEGLEQVARHIQLAPKRKKDRLKEALKYYQDSYDKGHPDALPKMELLKKQLKNS